MKQNIKAMKQSITTPYLDVPELSKSIEIEENIHWLRLPLPMTLDHVNVYAIYDPDGWTIVDTGMNSKMTRQIWPKIMSGPLSNAPVKRVILTHHHPDHFGMVGWFHEHYDIEIVSTRTAWLLARMLTLDVQEKPSVESVEFYRKAGVPEDRIEKYCEKRPFNFADCVSPIPVGFNRIQDGDRLNFGNRYWRVRIGHGHAPSHVTLWCENAPLVIGGDQFLADITPNIGVYATEPEANPLAEWLQSCARFQQFSCDHLVLPGHKRPFYGLTLRLEQLIDNHLTALNRIRKRLAAPATIHDIMEPLFERKIRDNDFGLAIAESVAHMNWLYHSGEVERWQGQKGEWIWKCS